MKKGHVRFALAISAIAVAGTSLADDSSSGDGWTEYNYDARGTRDNVSEKKLSNKNVGGLKIEWTYPAAGPVNGTPVVADGVVYVGDGAGFMYALTTSGTLLWKTQVNAPVSATVTLKGGMLLFGDQAGYLYGLKRSTGSIVWSFRPDSNPVAAIWGSGVAIGDNVAFGVASNEEPAVLNPSYPCCSSRGSVVLLEPKTGKVVWQTFMISDADKANGAAGASVWSTPTYDAETKTIYVTTGNNFSGQTGMSEAFVALDARTGAIRWVNQRTPLDTWNYLYPYSPGHVDADFGDSPQVYTLANCRKVVGAGQKSGFYHVLDAATGQLVNQLQVEPGGTLGGLFADTAVADGVVFANGINWPGGNPGNVPPTAGDLIAIAGDGSHELWRFTTPQSPDMSGVAVANGVVYFTSAFAGQLFALDQRTGAPLASVQISPQVGAWGGPSVVDGRVYVGTGVNFGAASVPGAITALGL
jgi:polyvinyl alcohol dehydrogenase (cytochrome)